MPRDSETILSNVCTFALEARYADIPAAVTGRAADLFLDTIGVYIGAHRVDAAPIVREMAATLFSATGNGASVRIPLDGRPASIPGAAYAFASQTDNLDGHDGYAPIKGHAGVSIFAALIAFAQDKGRGPVDGHEALACSVIGYEIACRAGLALHGTVSDYHTSGAWNALAVAAMGVRLRGQDADILRQALGIAEYHGPRSQMMREIDNPTMLHDGSGWGSLAGTMAVLLAEKGFEGAPAITIEGDEVAEYWRDIGSSWLTTEQYVKPYPVCRWAHSPIDAALYLMTEHGFSHDDIASINIASFHEATRLAGGMPATTAQAQYSLDFPVAMALVHGTVGPEQVVGDALCDADAARLVGVMTHSEKDAYNDAFPANRLADVAITLKDGRELQSPPFTPAGGVDKPFDRAGITDKFHRFADPVVGDARAARIASAVFALEDENAELDDVFIEILDPVAS